MIVFTEQEHRRSSHGHYPMYWRLKSGAFSMWTLRDQLWSNLRYHMNHLGYLHL